MNDFDKYLRQELNKEYPSPEHINRELIINSGGEFEFINLIFFIISVFQSLFAILIGVILVSDIFLKVILIGFGLFLFNISLTAYALNIYGEDVVE